MLFDDRWVNFCLTINWYAKAETEVETASAFAAAGSRALTLVLLRVRYFCCFRGVRARE
jgi:beta-lactamase class A